LTPEERVRQALVWFLTAGSNRATALWQDIRIGVEERSLDIACFAGEGIDARFSPSVTAVILETKRFEAELADHAAQLKGYMRRERCRAGLLFNARQAHWLTLGGEFVNPEWTVEPLADLTHVEERLQAAVATANSFVRQCREYFVAARNGNFDSLAHLVSLFGSDAGLTFSLSVQSNGALGLVGAFNLSTLSEGDIGYWIKGLATKRKRILTRTEFHSLRSVLAY
jgi:hypothetical protein